VCDEEPPGADLILHGHALANTAWRRRGGGTAAARWRAAQAEAL